MANYDRYFSLRALCGLVIFGLTTVGGALRGQESPHVVFVVGTRHYSPQESMPPLAKRLESYGIRTTVLLPPGNPERNKNDVGIPGLETVNASQARLDVEQANKRLQRPVGLLNDHDPEIERKSFKLLPGFEANLFAAEPMLVNPIHMTWDAQGRLWVCCSTSYPQVKPGEEPNDQIIVLEDVDGDGRADKSTVFADGLYVPTGLELGDGGVYVANAPDLLFLKDTDGDGKADVRRVVLTGFATEDNHHSISAWRWGPGGWLYFQEGTFMHSQVETPHGPVRLENGGVFQFRPRELRLRVFADYRASNPWGHMFDRWGQSVLIDNPRLLFLAPLTANSRAKLAYEHSGRGTKQAGGEFVSGRHLPEQYRGQIWTNHYKAHIVTRYEVSDDGAGFAIRELEPLIRSSSPYFRPVDLKVGPDGAAYVLDWYNPLIGHMQHSFRDERRDTTHGRVWRITHKDSPLVRRPKLVGIPVGQLLDHLKDPEDYTRHQVKRVLAEMDRDEATAALDRWVRELDSQDPGFEHHRLEALWCFQTIGVLHETLLDQVLESEDGRARAAAVRVLRYWHDRLSNHDPLELLSRAVADEHPRVRLEAVLSLGFVAHPQAVVIATRALERPMDRYIEHALRLTVDGLQPYWLAEYRAERLKFDNDQQRNFALSNILSNESVGVLIDMLNSGGVTADQLRGPAASVAVQATGNQLQPLVLTLVEHTREYRTRGREGISPAALNVVLEALEKAARRRDVVPPGADTLVARCLSVPDVETQIMAVRLIAAWRLNKESRRLRPLVNSASAAASLRIAASQALGELGGAANLQVLEKLCAEANKPVQQYLGAVGLAANDLEVGAKRAASAMTHDPQGADPLPLVSAFTNRKDGADLLATALASQPPHPAVAAAVGQYFVEVGQPHAGLIAAFGGGVSAGSLEDRLTRERPRQLSAHVRLRGDPARGEQIFRRTSLACLKCHAIGHAGPTLGPNLSAVGSSTPPDYIVDSLLRPSKVIKEFYESVTILTGDGQVINGILVLKDNEKIVVRDAAQAGREITIAMADVEELGEGLSLMPAGLANKLKDRQEFLDLARFVTELGRPGPYATSVAPVLRRWHLLGAAQLPDESELGALMDRFAKEASVTYSMVNGLLPAEDLRLEQPLTLAMAEVQVTRAGGVRLRINSIEGLRVFVDGRSWNSDQPVVQMSTGVRKLLFVVDTSKRREGLRVEVTDAPEKSAAFQVR